MDNDGEQKPLPHSLSDLAREPTVSLSQLVLKVQNEYTYDDILNFLDW